MHKWYPNVYVTLANTLKELHSDELSYLIIVILLYGVLFGTALMYLHHHTFSGIVTALTWPASLLAAASVIDNPWSVCLNRSAEVGKHLAQVLRSRQQV